MKFVTPQVYCVAETAMDHRGLQAYLSEIGVDDWDTNAESDGEMLAEVAGRLCYKSFAPGLNPNVTKVRQGNKPYLANIIAQQHGNVLEHASVSFIFTGVSRVFTHELVRHRVGATPSQESLRYVRLDQLVAYYPEVGFGAEVLGQLFDSYPNDRQASLIVKCGSRDEWVLDTADKLRAGFRRVFEMAENMQESMTELLGLEACGSFPLKKLITSAMRRLAPEGLGTAILWTMNLRAARDIIARRTSRHAEEEIRLVFAQVTKQMAVKYPAIFQDATWETVHGIGEVTFATTRV